jgi:hypothetical protein
MIPAGVPLALSDAMPYNIGKALEFGLPNAITTSRGTM